MFEFGGWEVRKKMGVISVDKTQWYLGFYALETAFNTCGLYGSSKHLYLHENLGAMCPVFWHSKVVLHCLISLSLSPPPLQESLVLANPPSSNHSFSPTSLVIRQALPPLVSQRWQATYTSCTDISRKMQLYSCQAYNIGLWLTYCELGNHITLHWNTGRR